MVLMCAMAFIPSGLVRSQGSRATGTLPVIVQSPECGWTNFYKGTKSPLL
jgi:hypothetical protein